MSTSEKNPYLLTLPQLLSAKKKIGKIAASFDPKKDSRMGFDSESLSPTEFREKLRYNFDLNLSPAELGALVALCDRDGSGNVNTKDFLDEFLRLGKVEKAKENESMKKSAQIVMAHKQRRKEEKLKKMENLMKVPLTDKFTDEDVTSALKKIAKVAIFYEQGFDTRLQGFLDGGTMQLSFFKDQLNRNLDIELTKPEFSGLCNKLKSSSDDQCIDCNEFLFHFFRLGREERERRHNQRRMQNETLISRRLKADSEITKHATDLLKTKVARQAGEEDRKSALQKIREVAVTFDPDRHIGFNAFESRYLEPGVFREQIKHVLGIIVTPAELRALVELLDSEGRGVVSCRAFIALFWSLGSEERMTFEKQHVMAQERLRRRTDKLRAQTEEKGAIRCQTKVLWPSIPKDADDPFYDDDDAAAVPTEDPMAAAAPSTAPGDGRRHRWCRKPPVHIEPSKLEKRLSRKKSSLVTLYPKASAETKEFLRDIEKQEKEINKLGVRKRVPRDKRRPKPDKKKAQGQSQSSVVQPKEQEQSRRVEGNSNGGGGDDDDEEEEGEGEEEEGEYRSDFFSSGGERGDSGSGGDEDGYGYGDFSPDVNADVGSHRSRSRAFTPGNKSDDYSSFDEGEGEGEGGQVQRNEPRQHQDYEEEEEEDGQECDQSYGEDDDEEEEG